MSTNSLFSSLLEQSRKLRQETDNADLPSIQLGLGEIERRAKELKKTVPGRTDARAYVLPLPAGMGEILMGYSCRRYLLRAGGIDADQNLRDLESIDFQTAYEPSGPIDTDVEVRFFPRLPVCPCLLTLMHVE